MPARLRTVRAALLCGLCTIAASPAAAQFGPPDPEPPRHDCAADMATDAKVECYLGQMTLAEKALYVSGTGFESQGVARLGIVPFRMSDGPKGVRTDGYPPTTAFPGGISLAATWNPALVQRASAAMGEEAKALGIAVLLGPGVNIQRYPLGGRNFEYYSEDPLLSGEIGVGWVKGVQGTGVAATPKHFAANNQETNRFWNNSVVDERTLREIYLPQFERIVAKAHPWAIMSSYNRINGTYASHDRWLLSDVLRGQWGFDGVVISDWTALHATADGMNAGLDLEMPATKYYGPLLADAVGNKQVELATLDNSVRRLLKLQMRTGTLAKRLPVDTASEIIGSPAHLALAREVAAESLVLLKNEGNLLPLADKARIAFIGPNVEPTTYQGAGSSEVTATRQVSVREAVVAMHGEAGLSFTTGSLNSPEIQAARADQFVTAPGGPAGLIRSYFASARFDGAPLASRRDTIMFATGPENRDPDARLPAKAIRWDGQFNARDPGTHRFNAVGLGEVRMFIDGKLVLSNANKGPDATFFGNSVPSFESSVALTKGLHSFRFERILPPDGGPLPVSFFRFGVSAPAGSIEAAVERARSADIAVVVVGLAPTAESEGRDRDGIGLPGDQDALVQAVAAANPRTVVVINAGGPVLMPWVDKVPAILEVWYPGQEGGAAVADALFGRISPSGKLPVTFPLRLEDSPAYPFAGNTRTAFYGEAVFVGYRGFDKRAMPVRFPFGHGLSYTSFAYSDPKVPAAAPTGQAVNVELRLRNTGQVEGAEVAQLYVAPLAPSEPRPVRELRGFAKLSLKPGEARTASFTLAPRDFAFWDVSSGDWRIEPGRYRIELGSSSRDIRLSAIVELTGPVVHLAAGEGH